MATAGNTPGEHGNIGPPEGPRPWKRLWQSWGEAFPRPWCIFFLLVYLVFTSLLICFWGFRSLPDNLDPLHYLLSAQAQTLGAILALVFTLTLVAAQLATKYTQRVLEQVMGIWTFWYLVPYLFGVAVPLFLLNGSFTLCGVRISLLLGGFCLALLVPYFFALRQKLSLGATIQGLRREAEREYDTQLASADRKPVNPWERKDDLPKPVEVLDNIAMGALANYDYETFRQAINALEAVGQFVTKAPEALRASANSLLERFIEKLGYLGTRERVLTDAEAVIPVTIALSRVGQAAVEERLGEAVGQATRALKDIGLASAERSLERGAVQAAIALGDVGLAAANKKGLGEPTIGALFGLGAVGKVAADKRLGQAAWQAALALGQIGTSAVKGGLLIAAVWAPVNLMHLGLAAAREFGLAAEAEYPLTATSVELQRPALQAASAIADVGVAAVKENLGELGEQVAGVVVTCLSEILYLVGGRKGLETIRSDAVRGLWRVGGYAWGSQQSAFIQSCHQALETFDKRLGRRVIEQAFGLLLDVASAAERQALEGFHQWRQGEQKPAS